MRWKKKSKGDFRKTKINNVQEELHGVGGTCRSRVLKKRIFESVGTGFSHGL
jgi:hypothetical protein